MKLLLILGLAIVLVTGFLALNMTSASAQSAKTYGCTSHNPCNYQVCGDHICAPGEFAKMMAQNNQAQMGNKTGATTPSTMAGGNMTSSSTGAIIGGVVSYEDRASDGTIVIVRTSHPIASQSLTLGIGFFGPDNNAIHNQNYAITITQDNNVVLSKPNAHTDSGLVNTLTTYALSSNDPINIQVTLNGVGPSTADPSTWTGVKGEVLSFSQGPLATTTTSNMTATTPASNNTAVPEFGPVASIILAIAVISVVVINTKTRVIPRF